MKKYYCATLLVMLFTLNGKSQLISPTFVDSVLASDNKYLKVDVYKPSSCSGQCPVILIQTPYNKNTFKFTGLPLGVKYNVDASNYIFVIMDWRGRFSNLGAAYSGNPGMGKDGKDVVEWIASQTWSNGKIGTWGPSALARVQYATAKENPPHLTCICPLVAAPQYLYNEYYPGGCLRTEYLQQLDNLGFGMSAFIMPNPVRNLLWQYTENVTYRPDSVFVPALMIGGWYDHAIDPMLAFFNGIRNQSPASVKDKHRLLMGPWTHGGNSTSYVGSINQGQLNYPNAEAYQDTLANRFFDYYLRAINNGYQNTPYVTYYQMGDDSWQNSVSWPPSSLTSLNFYMQHDMRLTTVSPTVTTGELSYFYDPTNPSPTIGGATLRNDLKQGPWRQDTAVENRSDILVFTTVALVQDLVVKGKVKVTLTIASDRKDTDFMIRLCDVYPDGKSMLVQTGAVRMRFRNGFAPSDTAVMTPGTVYTATVDLPATCITFKTGHRLRVSVSSSNYPQFNRNMNTGGPMYPGLNPDVLVSPVIASNTVYVNNTNQSLITLPVENTLGIMQQTANKSQPFIYPNPSDGNLNIQWSGEQTATLEIYDVRGSKVQELELENNPSTVSTTRLISGIYFIHLKSGNQVYSFKWLKN